MLLTENGESQNGVSGSPNHTLDSVEKFGESFSAKLSTLHHLHKTFTSVRLASDGPDWPRGSNDGVHMTNHNFDVLTGILRSVLLASFGGGSG